MVCPVPSLSEQEVRFCSKIKLHLQGDMSPSDQDKMGKGRKGEGQVKWSGVRVGWQRKNVQVDERRLTSFACH